MKTVVVRVTRERKIECEEYVDVKVIIDDAARPETVARELVEAQVAAGQDIAWIPVKMETEPYPRPIFTAEAIDPPRTETKLDPITPVPVPYIGSISVGRPQGQNEF